MFFMQDSREEANDNSFQKLDFICQKHVGVLHRHNLLNLLSLIVLQRAQTPKHRAHEGRGVCLKLCCLLAADRGEQTDSLY